MTDETNRDNRERRQESMPGPFEPITDNTGDPTDTTDTDDTTDRPESLVREDFNRRTFMLDDELTDLIDGKYVDLNARYYQQFGKDLPKSKLYYPAIFKNVDWEGVEDDIGLSD